MFLFPVIKPIRSIYVDFHKERQEACCAGKGVRLCTEKGNAAEAERHENDSTPLENGSGEEGAREGLPQFRDSFQQGVFPVVFTQGVGVIEKTYNRQNLEETHSVQDYAVQVKGGRKELKQVKRNAGRSGLTNTALTTVEGIGLGALGIGLPDIVVFVGMLLKGVYETALSYGFAYDTPEERLFILRMMETALTKGPDFAVKNARVDGMIEEMPQTGEDELQAQIQKTGSAFAVDMLLLKFVQGFPLVGILGGAANPVYYNKVMRYVQLKYQKRYLLAVAQRNGYSLRFL